MRRLSLIPFFGLEKKWATHLKGLEWQGSSSIFCPHYQVLTPYSSSFIDDVLKAVQVLRY